MSGTEDLRPSDRDAIVEALNRIATHGASVSFVDPEVARRSRAADGRTPSRTVH
ncbi:MAG TPA: hypothetical protein VL595_17985 [Pseudonocardia sp.]|jgi:hypothetical protein|nr:hypothetical protein [Pseudonocardia sp.]